MPKPSTNHSAASSVWRSVDADGSPKEERGNDQPEFEQGDSEFAALERRDMLKLMGASLALAGIAGACRRPEDKLLPYTQPPEHITPGVPNHFATVHPHADGAVGLLVTSHEGRPTKVEGNPDHPASLGAAGVWEQASVLQLYDPDRSRVPLRRERMGLTPTTWAAWDAFAAKHFAAAAQVKGKGLAILSGAHTSPTRDRLRQLLRQRFPRAAWHTWDLLEQTNAKQGAQAVFGPGTRVLPRLDQAKMILTVHADPLGFGADKLRASRGFAQGRRIRNARGARAMNRLIAVEAVTTVTGACADHRLPLPACLGEAFVRLLAWELFVRHKLPWPGGAIPPAILSAQREESARVAQGRGDPSRRYHDAQDDKKGDQNALGTPLLPPSQNVQANKAPQGPFVQQLARELLEHKGRAIVLVGQQQPPAVHALAHAINVALGGLGKTFTVVRGNHGDDNSATTSPIQSLTRLTERLRAGTVNTLVVLDGNPVHTAPGGLGLPEALGKVEHVIHAGLYADETAQHAHWHLPTTHPLETWSDARGPDGTAAIGQPLIDPLHNARSCDQLLWQIADGTVTKAQDLVRQTWLGLGKPLATEKQWRKAVHDGTIPGTAFPPASGKTRDPATSRDAIHRVSTKKTRVALHGEILPHFVRQDDKANKAAQRLAPNNLEVVFMPSYAVGDGRLANLAWLQELPDSMTKLTWGNALLLSPTLAKDMGIRSQTRGRLYQADVVRLRLGNSPAVETPTFVLPGLPPYSVVATLGYGRTHAGVVGNGVGVNFHPLLPSDGSLWALGGSITLTGKTKPLACTQEQFAMNAQAVRAGTTLGLAERDPTRNATAEHYRQHPDYVKAKGLPMLLTHKEGGTNSSNTTHAGATKESFAPLQTHKPWRYTGNKWGMVIDLTACIGCGACVTACQAENNIPVVGPAQVMRGRILHWIRVDRYYTGPVENPRAIHQPVVCMHCENAPCEPVCPVAATTHDSEGLNVMTYNRCIGTRYCANNCPYKVRRFNYLDYSNSGDMYVAPEKKRRQRLTALQHNPDVTVRYRGVMEKCTYCTQRIQQAKHKARLEKRDPHALRDGDVTPACAQTCPTQAITFGNLNDPNSAVATLKKADRDYQLLAELNTRPRTSYLGRLHNPLRGLATKPSADKKTS